MSTVLKTRNYGLTIRQGPNKLYFSSEIRIRRCREERKNVRRVGRGVSLAVGNKNHTIRRNRRREARNPRDRDCDANFPSAETSFIVRRNINRAEACASFTSGSFVFHRRLASTNERQKGKTKGQANNNPS